MSFGFNLLSCCLFISPLFSPSILLSNCQSIPDFSTSSILGLVFNVFAQLKVLGDQLYQFVLIVDHKVVILHQVNQIGPRYSKHVLLTLSESFVEMCNNHFFAF